MCGVQQMNYAQAVEFHEQTKAYGSILGLGSIRALMEKLGDVWQYLRIVHVAGTNGKGSVCCFLATVLKEAGYRTGQYSSPAVFGIRDAYRLNGELISEESYAACMRKVAKACQSMTQKGFRHPTVFEVETALAFLWFYQEDCDIVLLETGMGGGTDATNLIQKPLCSVFTSIRMDHMAFLGDSLRQIAEVKAGIIKDGCPVISVPQGNEAGQILREAAAMHHAPYSESEPIRQCFAENGRLYFVHPKLGEVRLFMAASYQAENASLAISIIGMLRQEGFAVTKEHLIKGLRHAVWPGRFECILNDPLFYIDGAHNKAAAERLKESLDLHFSGRRKIGIMGVMADKPYGKMLDILLPLFEQVSTVTPPNPRALPAGLLAKEIQKRGKKAVAKERVADAVKKAMEEAGGAVIVAFGSLFFLDEVKREAARQKKGGVLP